MRSRAISASLGSIAIASVGLVSTAPPANAAFTATVRSAVSATSSAAGTDYVASFRVSNRSHRAKTADVVSSVPGLGCSVLVKPRSLGVCKATAHVDIKAARAHSVTVKSGVGSELSFYPSRSTVITKVAKKGTGPGTGAAAYKKGTVRIDTKPGPIELHGYYQYALTISNPNDVALPVQVGVTPKGFEGRYPCGGPDPINTLLVPARGSIVCEGLDEGLYYKPQYVPGTIKFSSRGDAATYLQFDTADSGVEYPTDPADVEFKINTPYIVWDGEIKAGVETTAVLPISPDCFGSPAIMTVTSQRLGVNPGYESWPIESGVKKNEVQLTCYPTGFGPEYTVKFVPTAAEVKAQKISFDLTFTSRGGAKKSFTVDLAP